MERAYNPIRTFNPLVPEDFTAECCSHNGASTIVRKQLEDLKRLGAQIYASKDDVEARDLLQMGP